MLVLSRNVSQRIMIGDSIVVTVVQVKGGTVRIGIDAPPEIVVAREELLGGGEAAEEGGRFEGLARRPRSDFPGRPGLAQVEGRPGPIGG